MNFMKAEILMNKIGNHHTVTCRTLTVVSWVFAISVNRCINASPLPNIIKQAANDNEFLIKIPRKF